MSKNVVVHTSPSTTPEPAPTPEPIEIKDSDGDGVPDHLDYDPRMPIGPDEDINTTVKMLNPMTTCNTYDIASQKVD